MAIKIPILTEFDPKGLRQANASFANLQGSVRSLGANFALAGAAIAGIGIAISKNVESLARIETINAQTVQTITSMGNAANISAGEVEALAGRLETLTAVEAESIQEGANLLLTFGNIKDELGEGNDIFSQTTEIMVDMGVALRKGPVETATMLGKALNDPIQGLTALRRVGVSFTEQQIEQVKALQSSGDLMGAQKLILQELQNQYGGSGAAYAKTFTGQLELMGHELGTIGEEATMAVMPALQMMVEELRELIPVIGPQLKEAIESVDWAGLVTAVVNLATYFAQNAEAIVITATALWGLSTMIKTITAIVAISKLVIDLYTWSMGALATATGAASTALRVFRTVLITTGVGAILVGLGFLAEYFINSATAIDEATGSLETYDDQLGMTADQIDRLRDQSRAMPIFNIPEMPSFGGARGIDNAAQEAARAAEEAARAAAAEAARIAEEARRAEEERLEKRRAAYQSFADSVKSIFGQIKESILSSFNLPTLGNSVNSITRNIAKLLEKTKSFAKNITQLSGLGLNSALLQQVIQAGPIAGSQLASAIVGGGSAFISQLNSAYGEFGNLASGIAQTGTDRAFANQEVINNYYQIEVSGGVGSGPTIGKAIVDAIKSYERTSGAVWQGA
jgi:vacuolar-type H+-ATPase subunit E/Vma4